MPMCGLLITSFIIFTRLFPSCGGVSDVPPAPELVQVNSNPVILRCRTPLDHRGRLFRLFHVRELVDTLQFETELPYADFILKNLTENLKNFYCCQYGGSMISPYMSPKTTAGLPKPPAPPNLSVTPSGGRIQPGQVLDFHCQAAPTHTPVMFVLQRQLGGVMGGVQEVSRSVSPRFRVGPVNWADGGMYTCLYQIRLPEGVESSALSSPVSITIAVDLPTPRLSREDEGGLVCTGSPSYPGASFYLFHQGSVSPVATHHAPRNLHRAQFAVPERPEEGSEYQCLYRVQLGQDWAKSALSDPVRLTAKTSTHGGSVDLPLVVGSVSAALLFLLMLVFLAFGGSKFAKAAAEKRRQREQDQFWQQVHSRDHIIDLTLERISIGPKDLGLDSSRVSVSEPIYDTPFSSFTSPTTFH